MAPSTSTLSDKQYSEILRSVDFAPASYKELAAALMVNGVKQMFHAMVNEEDILTLFNIPNLKIFSICRCHHVADDRSTSHEHLHALVQYKNNKRHSAFKLRLKRKGERLHQKTTFKKILCPDHAVGVLRYITCKDGQRNTRRDADGLMGAPHTHYRRSVHDSGLLHHRNGKKEGGCKNIRERIQAGIEAHLTEDWLKKNVSGSDGDYLHHHESCSCDNGEVGKAKKLAANKKRSDFYSTPQGVEKKQRYKKLKEDRKDLVARVDKFMKALGKVSNQAELEKECIQQLLARM